MSATSTAAELPTRAELHLRRDRRRHYLRLAVISVLLLAFVSTSASGLLDMAVTFEVPPLIQLCLLIPLVSAWNRIVSFTFELLIPREVQ